MQYVDIKRNIGGLWRRSWNFIFPFTAKTAAYTILSPSDYGKAFTNTGAAGSVTFTLPAPKAGLVVSFFKTVIDQDIVVTRSGSAAIRSAGGTGTTLTNATDTEHGSLVLISDGTHWYTFSAVGTWALT